MNQIAPFEFVERRQVLEHALFERRRRQHRVRQVGQLDAPAAEDDETLDGVFELADVARPAIGRQRDDRFGRDHHVASGSRRGIAHELLDEQRDVFAPLLQRRNAYDDDAQAVEEILPESLLGDGAIEIDIRGGDDARVGVNRAIAADRTDLAVLQHAQQLHLHRRRHVADLVEKHRAAVRLLEDALAIRDRAGERAAYVAEQLRFEERLRDGAAVDRHKRLRSPRAVDVDGARDELLSRAALTLDEHRCHGIRGVCNLFVDREHPRRTPDDAFGRSLAMRLQWGRLPIAPERARDGGAHLADVERLADVVERAGAHRLHGGLERAEAADEKHLARRVRLLERLQHVETRFGSVQVDVGDDEIELLLARELDGLGGGLTLLQLASRAGHELRDQSAGLHIVIDDQDAGGKGRSRCHGTCAADAAAGNSIVNVVP